MKKFLLPCLFVLLHLRPLSAETAKRAGELISALIAEDTAAILRLSDGDLYYSYKHPSAETFRIRREYGKTYKLLRVHEFHRFPNGETIFAVRCDFSGRQIDFMVHTQPGTQFFCKVVDPGTILPIPTLEQLYTDFDYLTEMIEKFSPRNTPNRYLYQLDVSKKLAEYRSRIPQVHTLVDYAALVEAAVQACKGNHLWVANDLIGYLENPEQAQQEIVSNGHLVTPAAIPISYYLKTCQWRLRPSRPGLPLLYWQGNYYTRHDFAIGPRCYPCGMRLTAVNGRPVMEVLAQVQDRLTDFDWDRKFFFGNYEEYGDDFYRYLPEWQSKSFTLTFDKAGKTETVILNPGNSEKFSIDKPKITAGHIPPAVCYLPKPQLLYIRIPEMQNSRLNFYLSRIREAAAEYEIKAAVIDIRNNPGGSDRAWTKLLALLQTGKENTPLISAVNDNPDVIRFIARREFSKTDAALSPEELEKVRREYQTRPLAFPGGESYLILEETYPPISQECLFQESLPVYLLVQDVYSSAGNLAALAKRSALITSVGFDNPRDIGQGRASILFSLPYSKLIVRTNVWTDFSNCRTPEDTAHFRVEVPVELTPEQLVEYHNREVGNDLPAFLMTRDPFMRKVLELITRRR